MEKYETNSIHFHCIGSGQYTCYFKASSTYIQNDLCDLIPLWLKEKMYIYFLFLYLCSSLGVKGHYMINSYPQ